jgi:hypothetical protein
MDLRIALVAGIAPPYMDKAEAAAILIPGPLLAAAVYLVDGATASACILYGALITSISLVVILGGSRVDNYLDRVQAAAIADAYTSSPELPGTVEERPAHQPQDAIMRARPAVAGQAH